MKLTKGQISNVNAIINGFRKDKNEESLNVVKDVLSALNIPTHETKGGWLAGAPAITKAFEVGKTYGEGLFNATILSRTKKTVRVDLSWTTEKGTNHEVKTRNVIVDPDGVEKIYSPFDLLYIWATGEID